MNTEDNKISCCDKRRKIHSGRLFVGSIIVFSGILFLAKTLNLINFQFTLNFNIIVAVIIILIGLSILIRRGWFRAILAVVVALLIAFTVFYGIFYSGVGGSGNIITKDVVVSNFDKITLSSIGNLHIVQGKQESLTIEAEDNVIDGILVRVDNKTLYLEQKHDWWKWPIFRRDIDFYLTVKDITKISVSGVGSIKSDSLKSEDMEIVISGASRVDLKIDAKTLKSEISGVGDIIVTGKVNSQKLSVSGAANYNARELESKEADIKLSGASKVQVFVKDKLNIDISGASKLFYRGDPQISQNVSGVGKVEKIN